MNTNKIKNLFYHVGLLSQLPEDLRPPSPSENYSKSMNDNNTNNNKKNGWRILYTLSNSFSNSFDNKDDNELIHEDSISLSDDGTNNNDCDDTMYSDQSSVKSIIKKILSVKSLSLSYKGPFSNNDGNEESGYIHYDVFLGGSCGHTIWRRSLVIPYLIKRDISYYDPQRKFWTEAMIYEEAIAKENSSLFLYVLDPETINAVSFLEIAYFASRKTPKLVVVFLDKKEWKGKAHPLDLPDRQRTCDLIELILTRHNVPLLTSINEALDYVDDMIIGEKNWKIALKNKKQRMTFLKIQCQRMFINLKKKLTSYRILPKYYKKPYVKSSIDKYQSDDFNYCKNIFILISIEIIILIFLIFTFPTYLFLLLPPNIYNIFLFLVVILLFNISCLTGIPKIQKIIKKFHSNRYQISEKTLILPNPPIMRTKSFMLNENGERIMENGKLKSPTNLLSNDILESLKDKNDEKNNNINKDIPSTKQNLPANKYLYNTKNRGMSTNEMFPKITRQSASGSLLKPYPVGYDVFLSCSSSNELDWITQKAIPILEYVHLLNII
uniref:Raw n=1 Tax=Parastrongyloides trichosuri TaxID=131310 RepID=A0A0N4Z799_PARTI